MSDRQQSLRFLRDDTPISFPFKHANSTASDLDQLTAEFMYTQLLKENLLDMEYNEKALKDMVAHWMQKKNLATSELEFINNFVQKYDSTNAIRLYTHRTCIYRAINEALRLLKADVIVKMGFFVQDLHQEIKKLHKEQTHLSNGERLTLYRGQGSSEADLEGFKAREGGLVAFNGFLSTSVDRDVSLALAESNSKDPESPNQVGILFRLTVDPKNASTPFADIRHVSKHPEENEILFSTHPVFRIGKVSVVEGYDNVYEVLLTLTADNDEDLLKMTGFMKKKLTGDNAQARLAKLLIKTEHYVAAEELYKDLLKQEPSSTDAASYYHHLGFIKDKTCNYQEGIKKYKMAIAIRERNLHREFSWFAESYRLISDAHEYVGNIQEAKDCRDMADKYQDLISLFQLPARASHHDETEATITLASSQEEIDGRKTVLATALHLLASTYENVGVLHKETEDYTKALPYHYKALDIREGICPEKHSSLAISYNNIGKVYFCMGQKEGAWSVFKKALEIAQEAFVDLDPDLATCLKNIGTMLSEMGKHSEAQICIERALTIQTRILPANHRDLSSTYAALGTVYFKMERYSEAISYHQKTLDSWVKDLSADQKELTTCYNNIGVVHWQLFLNCVGNSDSQRAKHHFDNARSHLEHARVVSEKHFGLEAAETKKVRNDIQWMQIVFDRIGDRFY